MIKQPYWNTQDLAKYAEKHTIKECAANYGCSYIAMQHYLLRHKIEYKRSAKGVRGKAHYAYKHGETKSRLYRIWTYMRRRCNDSRDKDFISYGARGIKVCEAWNKDYLVFRNWALVNGYNDKLTLDRIDFNGNYSPYNCRWVTIKEQNNNRRTNRLVTYKGVTLTVAQWAEKLGLERHALLYRLNNWTVEEALTKTLQRR